MQYSNCLGLFSNHPTRGKWYLPARVGIFHFYAIQIGIGSVVFFIVFNAPFRDLSIYLRIDFFLSISHFFGNLFPAPHNMKSRPSQKGGNGIEITGIHITTHSSRFKGNAPSPTKSIPHFGSVTEFEFTEFFYEFWQRIGISLEIRVYFFPSFGRKILHMLGTNTVVQFFIVVQRLKCKFLKGFFFIFRRTFDPRVRFIFFLNISIECAF